MRWDFLDARSGTHPVFHFAKARTTSAPVAQAMMVTRKMELTTGPSPAAFMDACKCN